MRRKSVAKSGSRGQGGRGSGTPVRAGLIMDAVRAKLAADPTLARALAATAPRPPVAGTPPTARNRCPAALLCCIVHELRGGRAVAAD